MNVVLAGLRRLEREHTASTANYGPAALFAGDAIEAYPGWTSPACIISDGPYGLGKYPGEPKSPDRLEEWYAPHAAAWARAARPDTTLWFWNSELGWAHAHRALALHGWEYQEAVIWDKGINHVAGNVNSKTIRGLPVVTEIAVRYTRRLMLRNLCGDELPAKQWLREEWLRSGLPLSQSNAATGTANAGTRKYLTQCDLWYFPPGDAVVGMAEWCTRFGRATDRPYFSIDGHNALTVEGWNALRSRWNHEHGITNVWHEPPVHHSERVKVGTTYLHANQKPLALLTRQITAVTAPGELVWEPFGGLCSASVAALHAGRRSCAAEINKTYVAAASARLESAAKSLSRFAA